MLDALRQNQKWIVVLVVITIGFVFAFVFGAGGGTFGGGPAIAGAMVQLGNRGYNTREVEQRMRNVLLQQQNELGEDFDADAARPQALDQVINSLLIQMLLAQEAEALGLAVSRAEVQAAVRRLPGFANADENAREILEQDIISQYGSINRYQEIIRDELLADKARRLIMGSVAVADAEVRSALQQSLQTSQIAAVRLPTDEKARPDLAAVTAEEISAFAESDAAQIQQRYETRRTDFEKPERVRARHMLVRARLSDAPEQRAQARAKLEAAQARVAAGESFAAVAQEISEDESADQGGSLGLVPRGELAPALDSAAFALEAGGVSEIVETPRGFHLLLVEEKLAAESKSLEQARDELAREILAQQKAAEAARTLADALAEEIRGGGTLVAAARARELPILRPSPFTRDATGEVPELGAAPEIMAAAFARESGADPTVYELNNDEGAALVLVEVLARGEPTATEISAQMAMEREELLEQRRFALQNNWLNARLNEYIQNGEYTPEQTEENKAQLLQ